MVELELKVYSTYNSRFRLYRFLVLKIRHPFEK